MKLIMLLILNILLIRFQIIFFPNLILLEVPLVIGLWYFLDPENKPSYGIFFSTFLGLVSDFLFGYPLGLYGFSLTFTGYITYHIYNKLYIQSKVFLFFVFVSSHFINFLIFLILIKFFHISVSRDLIPSIIVSSIIGSFILTFVVKKK